jgi:hypothetical protein
LQERITYLKQHTPDLWIEDRSTIILYKGIRMQKVPFGSQANSLSTDPFLNKPESSSKGKFNFSRVIELYRTLKPLSLPNTDSSGNIIQLWKVDQQGFLLGSVIDKTGQLKLIPSHKITHPLGGEFQKDELIKRLERFHPRQWSFVFDPIKLELVVWPRLIAAGHGDIGQVDTYIAKLDSKTLSAALREKNGEIVKFHKSGRSYDKS